jgi:Flp pilus assembly protein TadG
MSGQRSVQRNLVRPLLSGQHGQVIVWVAVMLPLLLSIIGLTIDGGLVFSARRELQNAADSAARAGAMQVDERAYRESGGERVVLDEGAARRVAAEYLGSTGAGLDARITTESQRVVVQVSREVPTSFMRLAGINRVRISATAPAELRYGIEQGNRSSGQDPGRQVDAQRD